MKASVGLRSVCLIVLAACQTNAQNLTDRQTQLAVSYMCGAESIGTSQGPRSLVMIEGMGRGGFPIRTHRKEAQDWFDFGIKLYHAFYHEDAKYAFRRASKLDPACAMCAWGEALAAGPTMNYDLSAEEIVAAAQLAWRAASLLGGDDSPRDRELIEAMILRYSSATEGEGTYARAMTQLAERYVDEPDFANLAAHALITLARRGDRSGVDQAVSLLEAELAHRPDDTAAIHYYIHAREWAGDIERTLPFAELLVELAPKASHLVHMASHSYLRVGRYHEAAVLNANAMQVDAEHARTQGIAGALGAPMYYGHNFQFGLAGALMSGDSELALKFADHATKAFPPDFNAARRAPVIARSYIAYAVFDPEAALAIPEQETDTFSIRLMRHYARGEAYARLGRAADVENEALAIAELDPRPGERADSTLKEISRLVLEGRAKMALGDGAGAANRFEQAAVLQETRYRTAFDPPPWWYPVRRSVAAAYFLSGDYVRAAQEASACLENWPNDPLALWLLGQCEIRTGRIAAGKKHLDDVGRLWAGQVDHILPELI